MSTRYRRRYRKSDTDGVFGLVIIAILAVAAYRNLSTTSKYVIVGTCITIIFLFFALVLLVRYHRVTRERQKLQALTAADIQSMDGLTFEKYVAALLENEGYKDISLTEKYDMGVDIIATKDGIRWGIQVKRYSYMVKVEAVRQVVAALNAYHCERAMVVTNSYCSRPAQFVAQSNNCILVDRDTLAEWIVRFQAGSAGSQELITEAPSRTH